MGFDTADAVVRESSEVTNDEETETVGMVKQLEEEEGWPWEISTDASKLFFIW